MKQHHSWLCLALAVVLPQVQAAAPHFFAMDTGTIDATHKTPAEQVALTKELGFDGIGPRYFGAEQLRAMMTAADAHKLKVDALYVALHLDAAEPLSAEIRDSIEALRGRDSILWLWLEAKSLKPSDPAGDARAVAALREIAALAEPAGVKIALYPHQGVWVERIEDAVRVARAVDRKNVGVTFNLCHWLKVDGQNLEARLKEAQPHLFVVTINGADAGGQNWNTLIQPLGRGTYDVASLLTLLKTIGWNGPIGLQHFGIKGDAKANLSESMTAWKKMAGQVWRD
ncbi:MAG TPA: sugar phosphate isomerase/epimerase family protein [Luteolibacter sp.]|nr:sugar phosphate isomerase/epimerase family protein [Luteolibacter sp.]